VYAARGDESLHLDLYRLTTSHTPAPLVVVIHGGSWQGGGSEQLSALNHYLAARGYAVAAITYRLSPRHRFPAAHHDVVAALDYLTAHAGELGIDANKVVFLGRSAGAQLALLAAYTLRRPAIRGVVSLYGPTDLHWGYDHPANRLVIDTCRVLEDYLGGSPKEAPEVYTAASPMTFVDAHSPPTLLIHGAQDEMVFLENSRRLAARLTDAARPHFLVTLPWAAHGCDANFNGPSGQISTYAIEYFLNAVTSDAALS
jgi:acetyl esterase/lipase